MQAGAKSDIRRKIQSLREQLPVDDRIAFSRTISENLSRLEDYRQAGTVLGYMNFGAEFASELWIRQVLADRKRLVLPRVNRHTSHLDLYWVDDPETQLAQGLWGIREPIVERCERLDDINNVEFALLPGVAFTRSGARLGYGGGYYDKLLGSAGRNSTSDIVLVVAAFSLQLVEHLPEEPTDVRVHWIVTESDTIDCSNYLE